MFQSAGRARSAPGATPLSLTTASGRCITFLLYQDKCGAGCVIIFLLYKMDVYDFIHVRQGNVIGKWVRELRGPDRARFKLKVRALSQIDYDRAIGTKLLQGPVYKHIYKLKIHGEIMMRPLLCRGPIDNDSEYTLLVGAREENFKLLPSSAPGEAGERRQQVIDDPANRRQIRVRSRS